MVANLSKIGAIVASEVHGLATWTGKTSKYWAKFSEEPSGIPFDKLRSKIIDVIPFIDMERPEGYIWIVCFDVQERQ